MQPPTTGRGALLLPLSRSPRPSAIQICALASLGGYGGWVEHCSRSLARWLRHRARALARVR
eukprot:3588282-Pleurochrysis_carterae.AAC.1